MIHQPEQKNRAPEATVLALFLCATVGFVFASFSGIAGRGFLQGMALVFFCAMIYILVRYKFFRIRYIVRPNNKASTDDTEEPAASVQSDNTKSGSALRLPPDRLDFVVEKAQGRRVLTAECVLSLGNLISCIPLPQHRRDRRKITRQYKKAKTYRYLRNMVGAHQCMLIFSSREMDDVKLIIEPSEEMEGYLSAVARFNREKKEA
ncbi:MAG: hypothetical protein HFE66_00290 [Clostridiales bacterium]|nr:hypothetical protein [Clostridiales bacterium]